MPTSAASIRPAVMQGQYVVVQALALLARPAPRGKLLGFCGRGPVLCCAPAVVWRAWAVGVLA
jgi:hypothetical protein